MATDAYGWTEQRGSGRAGGNVRSTSRSETPDHGARAVACGEQRPICAGQCQAAYPGKPATL